MPKIDLKNMDYGLCPECGDYMELDFLGRYICVSCGSPTKKRGDKNDRFKKKLEKEN